MFKGIMNWIKNIIAEPTATVEALSTIVIRPARNPYNKNYLNDPSTPDLIIEEAVPADTLLPMISLGDGGNGAPVGSIQQQALAAKQMVNNALKYMVKMTPDGVRRWAAVSSLTIMPRAGKDVNAYYDRTSLRFFYFGDPIVKKIVYSCDSRPVVVHEFGHAYLDILRPDFWDTQCAEIWAFHEFFGDATAILSMLQYDQIIQRAIDETNGDLLKSNIITRMAAEMGIGLFNLTGGEDGSPPNCLRDLSVRYDYVPPETLPTNGRDDQIINESHSFSRIYSGAFYESIIKISRTHTEVSQIEAVKIARDVMAKYLISATKSAPMTIRFFNSISRQILCIDQATGGKYQDILKEVFTSRNLLIPQITMLADIDADTLIQGMKEPYEIQIHGNSKIVKTIGSKKIKLSEKVQVLTLENNPLFDLEIDVPNESAYYFNEENKLMEINQANDDEIIDAAYTCLKIIHENNLMGDHETAIFSEKDGKLVRKQIICTCGRPNYCDPNAPEYQKPWKPANNAGCVKCHSKNCKPQSCDCNPQTPLPPPKTGCFTTTRMGGIASYKYGSSASRKVC